MTTLIFDGGIYLTYRVLVRPLEIHGGGVEDRPIDASHPEQPRADHQRYDENDNLIEKVLTLDGAPYALNFTYDALDGLATLTYPSGRAVDYLPDAFGRPTQAAPYLSGVSFNPSGQLRRPASARAAV